jgi:hypothetical protein
MALKRLECTTRKAVKEDVFDIYKEKIQEYVDKGYAIELSEQEAAIEGPRVWYLPHFFRTESQQAWQSSFGV